jgi:nucleotidyltransferase/DNA polymerase involved in DNA repair
MSWFAAICIPQFSLQAVLRLREETWAEPIAVIEEEAAKGHVLEMTDIAAHAGVRRRMVSTQALARCPTLRLWPRSSKQEQTITDLLIETAGTLSPFVEATAESLCVVDLRWLKPTDWQQWAHDVVARFEGLKLRVKVGLAANPDLAVLVSRRAKPALVVHYPATFLTGIAVAEINAPPELIAMLRDWGINSLGDLARLSRHELVERLGQTAGELWNCATGRAQRELRLVRPIETFVEAFDFDCPIETTEPLLFILQRILDQLTTRLRGIYRVAAKMALTLLLEDGALYERFFTIPAPTLETEVLFRILHTHLENLNLKQQPVGLRLLIEPAMPEGRQFQLFESQLRDPNRFGETLARLTALVGVGNAGVAELEDTHHPDSFRLVEPQFEKMPKSNGVKQESRTIGLPLHRFRPPFSAQVQLTRHVPAWVFSQKAHGEIVDAAGPYRVSGGWWDREAWTTEEWDIELDCGALYHLSKQEDTWFVEGCYDAPLC